MSESAAYKEDISFEPDYRSLAALADESAGLTCSVTVGRAWAPGRVGAVVGYPEFELVAESVRSGEHDLLLVPAAYPDIRGFFFDAKLHAIETFLGQLPDMVFAVPTSEHSAGLEIVFHHPAAEPLLVQIADRHWHSVYASSNSAACRDAVEQSAQRVR